MRLTSATRIAGYEVIGPLGAGGMGEVYRARDVRLRREVALKVLPSAIGDAERLARFEREARVLASLNHPHIAAIYGVEESVGEGGSHTPVLVLELVEGETLEERIARGALPADEAIAVALQIADALEAAHDKGIVHRDLKPANVKRTPDGTVKVLDFGLAKAWDDDRVAPSADPAHSPTMTSPGTVAGMILGTPAYMAPEQVRGALVDRRADIWAFGAVSYEMLTGVRAFSATTVSDTLAAVLTSRPDWSRLPSDTPVAIRHLVQRCLEPDPRLRLQAIGEARIVLSTPSKDESRVMPRRRSRWLAPLAVVVLALGVTAFASAWWLAPTGSPAPTPRMLDLAVDNLEVNLDFPPALSPDGQRVVYRAGGRLWVRALTDFAPKALPSSEDARYAFWSPDSTQVGFVRDQQLWRVALDSEEVLPIGAVPRDLSGSGGGVWTDQNEIVLSGSDVVGLFSVPLNGGPGREVLPLDRAEESDFHEVSALPDGRGLLFTTHRLAGPETVDALVDGTRRTVLHMPGDSLRSPVYAPGGYLLFTRETTVPGIWAIRFALDTLETSGDPFLVVPNGTWPTVGAEGTLFFVRASDQASQLVWIDRSGAVSPVGDLQGRHGELGWGWPSMSLSPDRQRLAVGVRQGANTDLWSHDLMRGTMTRLSLDAGLVVSPTWTPDGGRVLFSSFFGERAWSVHQVPSTHAVTPERLLAPVDEIQWPCDVSPDGRWLVYVQGPMGQTDLWMAPLDGTSAPRPLMSTPFRETDAKFSPDGRWLAFVSNQSGRSQVYVRGFAESFAQVQMSTAGAAVAAMPAWSPTGTELFYRTPTALMAVTLSGLSGELQASPPRQLFAMPDQALSPSFGVSADGQRFLFVRSGGVDRLSVILNWANQEPGRERGGD